MVKRSTRLDLRYDYPWNLGPNVPESGLLPNGSPGEIVTGNEGAPPLVGDDLIYGTYEEGDNEQD